MALFPINGWKDEPTRRFRVRFWFAVLLSVLIYLPSAQNRHIVCKALEQNTDTLDSKLSEEGIALAKLKGNLAENKKASQELKESLENLEAVTKKIEEDRG
jgi:hypothetical protein